MAHLIEVAFKGNRKDFFIWEQDEIPPARTPVVVEADRGEDIGYVHATGELAAKRNAGASHGYGAALPSKRARRAATGEELDRLRQLREQDEDARHRAVERVKANGLAMKVSDAEWQWDRKKLTFYFTAEKRVDFRTLVRELASAFRTRIELKQIGVRDEAKRLDGVGRCGRQYCSASWLPELLPVNLGVAKDQRLSLNPTQISGACGRLMCCLRYEHDFYVQSRKRFPKEGRVLVTSRGEEKVVANDIFRERVTLRGTDGENHIVPLAELREDVAKSDPDAGWLRNGQPGAATATESAPAGGRARNGQRPSREPEDAPLDDVLDEEVHDDEQADETPAASAAGEGEGEAPRRPHRRRGRRGGRRNRNGGQRPPGDHPDASEHDGGGTPPGSDTNGA